LRQLDHLVVAASDVESGARWVEAQIGVAPGPGGKHVLMGTHNRLLSLGPGVFLEVLAIDPDAPPPARPRWFELDTPAMKARLAKSPVLLHWVERTDDLEAALRDYSHPVEILSLSRGAYRWRMGVTRDGSLPGGGEIPTLIQWEGARPADALADSGCRLLRFEHRNGVLTADFSTPSGVRTIR